MAIGRNFGSASFEANKIDKSLQPALKASGFSWDDRGFWRNAQKPGQYLDTKSLTSLISKQKQAGEAMDPNSYNPGVDYTAAVSPFLGQGQANLSSLMASGPQQVSGANEYEGQLRQLLQNPDSIANTGAYKFALGQGQQALERSQAAKGMSASGNTLAELMKYGQGMASQQYGAEADRLARLSGQQQNYILGQRGANVADYSARINAANTGIGAGGLALRAAESQAGDYWKGQQTAQQAGRDTGYYNQNIW